MSRISALKKKISKLVIKNNSLENSFTIKFITAMDKEIIELKQVVQCKQVEIDSMHLRLNRLDTHIKNSENKKIGNRLKKLFMG